MRIELLDDVETTEECVAQLNKYKQAKWKRKTKFNIKLAEDNSSVVRCFSDGTETLSILQTESDGAFLVNFDLSSIKPLIEQIQKLAKKYFTHDYGQVYLNPWDMKLWVVGGDGGIIYSEKPPGQVARELENGGMEEVDVEKCPGFETKIPQIKSTVFEGEEFPPLDPSDCYDDEYGDRKMEWIHVANTIDICNLMEF